MGSVLTGAQTFTLHAERVDRARSEIKRKIERARKTERQRICLIKSVSLDLRQAFDYNRLRSKTFTV